MRLYDENFLTVCFCYTLVSLSRFLTCNLNTFVISDTLICAAQRHRFGGSDDAKVRCCGATIKPKTQVTQGCVRIAAVAAVGAGKIPEQRE